MGDTATIEGVVVSEKDGVMVIANLESPVNNSD